MQKIKKIFCLLCCFIPVLVFGQAINNANAIHSINGQKYFRFHYDNDFFTATDEYYSQGINVELVHPSLKKSPFSKALLKFKNSSIKYGIAVEHNCYTPTSIRHSEIIYNDRPFAACLVFKTFMVSVDTMHGKRLSAVLSTGIIGPSAFGAEMQKAIHRGLKNIEPLGWQHQIKNDLIINYELSHEKQVYAFRSLFSASTNLKINCGTLKNNAQAGFTLMAGKINSPFKSFAGTERNNFQIYFFAQPLVTFVAYDATLQGGVFNHSSPYTLDADEISRIVFEDNFGAVITIRKIYLEYYQSWITKEYKTGKSHRWGGLKIGLII